ncbi:MAG: hypothetical protein ACRD34_07340, partial [Bryobacteraceae bacterium]
SLGGVMAEGVGAGPGENTRFSVRGAPSELQAAPPVYLTIAWAVFAGLAYLPNFAPKRSIDPRV